MKLTLYYAPNTCATVPYITLTEAGADFDVHNVNTRTGGNRTPGFLRLNPKHKVPVLIIEDLLAGREWLFPHFTTCDAYFFWCFRRALSFKLDLSAFRNCTAHFKRMEQRPSAQKVIAHEKKVQEEFARAA